MKTLLPLARVGAVLSAIVLFAGFIYYRVNYRSGFFAARANATDKDLVVSDSNQAESIVPLAPPLVPIDGAEAKSPPLPPPGSEAVTITFVRANRTPEPKPDDGLFVPDTPLPPLEEKSNGLFPWVLLPQEEPDPEIFFGGSKSSFAFEPRDILPGKYVRRRTAAKPPVQVTQSPPQPTPPQKPNPRAADPAQDDGVFVGSKSAAVFPPSSAPPAPPPRQPQAASAEDVEIFYGSKAPHREPQTEAPPPPELTSAGLTTDLRAPRYFEVGKSSLLEIIVTNKSEDTVYNLKVSIELPTKSVRPTQASAGFKLEAGKLTWPVAKLPPQSALRLQIMVDVQGPPGTGAYSVTVSDGKGSSTVTNPLAILASAPNPALPVQQAQPTKARAPTAQPAKQGNMQAQPSPPQLQPQLP